MKIKHLVNIVALCSLLILPELSFAEADWEHGMSDVVDILTTPISLDPNYYDQTCFEDEEVVTVNPNSSYCSMYYESNVTFSLNYQSLKDKPVYNLTFEECTALAESKLGTMIPRKGFLFNDLRMVTDVKYKYSDKMKRFEGHLTLKQSH